MVSRFASHSRAYGHNTQHCENIRFKTDSCVILLKRYESIAKLKYIDTSEYVDYSRKLIRCMTIINEAFRAKLTSNAPNFCKTNTVHYCRTKADIHLKQKLTSSERTAGNGCPVIMTKMACTKHLSIGNRAIDSAHKEAFDMIDKVVHLIMAKNVAALTDAFGLLEDCLCTCFLVEENIAQAAGFDFTSHSLAHQGLLNEFQRIKNWLTKKNGAWSEFEKKGCIDSLRNCLIRHIKEDSKPLKIVLETHFYDFNS